MSRASPPRAGRKDAVIYQIFPDRFRNGRSDNDPKTGDVRYDDPVIKLGWGILPEGFCRNYADGATNCPWRFDTTPPADSPTKEQPRGRDYYGGDLKGVDQQLDYLDALGVTALYFNPIFDAGSNHSLRHPGLQADRSVLRDAEGLRQSDQAREDARDPGDPRRGVQPHELGQPAVRPVRTLRDRRRLRVARVALPLVVRVQQRRRRHGHVRRGRAGRCRPPTRAGSGSTRSPSSTRPRPPSRATS